MAVNFQASLGLMHLFAGRRHRRRTALERKLRMRGVRVSTRPDIRRDTQYEAASVAIEVVESLSRGDQRRGSCRKTNTVRPLRPFSQDTAHILTALCAPGC